MQFDSVLGIYLVSSNVSTHNSIPYQKKTNPLWVPPLPNEMGRKTGQNRDMWSLRGAQSETKFSSCANALSIYRSLFIYKLQYLNQIMWTVYLGHSWLSTFYHRGHSADKKARQIKTKQTTMLCTRMQFDSGLVQYLAGGNIYTLNNFFSIEKAYYWFHLCRTNFPKMRTCGLPEPPTVNINIVGVQCAQYLQKNTYWEDTTCIPNDMTPILWALMLVDSCFLWTFCR